MFKKLLIASAVLAASTSIAFAANYKGDYKGETVAPCPTYNIPPAPYVGVSLGVRNNYSGTPAVMKGIDGNLSLGYGGIVSPAFYLAGELFVLGTANVKDMSNNGNSVRSNWSWGGSVLPGYMITDHVLGYVRLGAQRTRFNSQGSNANAWHVGLGAQTNIYQNWDLRGEYVYSYYQNVSGVGHPNSDVFNLGLVYRII